MKKRRRKGGGGKERAEGGHRGGGWRREDVRQRQRQLIMKQRRTRVMIVRAGLPFLSDQEKVAMRVRKQRQCGRKTLRRARFMNWQAIPWTTLSFLELTGHHVIIPCTDRPFHGSLHHSMD
eukprot:2084616-Rhodomonas_salina.2